MSVQVSLVASANRVKFWDRMYNNLKGNKINWELILVGDTAPINSMPSNFRWIKATVKPAQCYNIGFFGAQGELIAWTADDANYNHATLHCSNSIDIAYNYWQDKNKLYNNDRKTVVAMNPCEDGGWPQEKFHYFFGGCSWSPRMAPFGVIDREYFVKTLGGYDREFISGQSENDAVMRVFEDGGRVEFCKEAVLYVNHREVHPKNPMTGREDNKFRKWYNEDRRVLENAWVKEGYGSYEKLTPQQLQQAVNISEKRLKEFKPFENNNTICSITQGQKGHWQ